MRADVWDNCWAKWKTKKDFEEDIQQHISERKPLYEFLTRSVTGNGKKPIKILEVGCGTAIDSGVIAQDTRTHVIGVDRSLTALSVAKKITSSFTRKPALVSCDASSLSFADESFDVVFSQGLLEHFHDPMPLLKEQVRVLRKTGYLIIDVPQKYAGFGTYSFRKHLKIRKGKWEWGWETEYSYPELKRMGIRAGLVPLGKGGYGFDGLTNLFAHPDFMIDRHGTLARLKPMQVFKRMYSQFMKSHNERLWNWLSERFGHWFLISIVVWFQKR